MFKTTLQLTTETAASLTVDDGQPNAGGINWLRLVPASQVRILKPQAYTLPSADVFAPHTLFSQHLYFDPDAVLVDVDILPPYASFSDDMEATPNGELFRPTIQLVIPKVRPDLTAWLQKYRGVRWIAFLQDRNGFARCVGNNQQPLQLTAGSGSGAGTMGRNQMTLTFTAAVPHSAYYLTGIDDADVLADFDESFNFDFNS